MPIHFAVRKTPFVWHVVPNEIADGFLRPDVMPHITRGNKAAARLCLAEERPDQPRWWVEQMMAILHDA